MPISLGQITFGIGADTTRLRSSIQDVTRFGSAVEQAAANTAAGSNVAATALMKQERAAISALQKVQKFQDAVGRLQAPDALINGLNRLSTRGLDQVIQRMTQGQLTTLQYQREIERFGQTMTNAQRILRNYSEAQRQAEATSLVASLQKLSSAAVLVAGPLSGIATRLSVLASLSEHFSISWAAMIAGVAGGTFAFYKLATSAIEVEKSLQGIGLALTAVYGNVTIANTQFKYLSDLSDKTGVSFAALAKQYAQIEAAAKGTNVEGERTRKVFESIVFAGAKLGLSSDEVKGALVAVQQMISKGTISSEELRQQLGDRLPGAVQIMAQALGVTTMKLQQMMKQSQVGISVLPKFADALLKRYNIDTAANIDTITAAEGRLNNARIRALDTLDKQIGFSSAYKNILTFLAQGLTGATASSSRFVEVLGAVAGALVGAFASMAVVRGLTAITMGVRAVAAAVAGLNFATLAGAGGSLLSIIARLGLALAGGVAGYKLMQSAVDGTSQSFLNATPAVKDYLAAQQKMVSTDRMPTLNYLKEQTEALATLTDQRKAAADALRAPMAKVDLAEGLGASNDQLDKLWKNLDIAPKASALTKIDAKIKDTSDNIKQLNDLLKKQAKLEDNPKPDPVKEQTNRQILAVKKAQESIRSLGSQYNILFMAPAAREQAEMLEQVTHQTEQFKQSLERAQIPAGKLKTLVEQYHASLLKLKEGEIIIRNQVSSFQMLGGVFSRGVDQGLGEFIDVIVDGKDKMLAFGDTVRFVAKDILKTLLQLAALNPLKNFLFGMNSPTLGGSAGIGGFLGNMFGGGGGGSSTLGFNPLAGAFSFANGGIMSGSGSMPLRRYAKGGIASGPQTALFGEGSQREAYVPLPDGRSIPVTMAGGNGGVEFHVHEAPGTKVTQQTSKSASGGVRIDVMVQQMVRDTMHGDIASGGPISRSLEKQYGMNRAKGLA